MKTTSIKTTIVTVDDVINNGTWKWNKCENDIDFKGEIPGYTCGFNLEVKNNETGVIDYFSCVFTNDFEEILLPEDEYGNVNDTWNDLGISATLNYKWTPTGRIVFRGYFTSHWIEEEREYGFMDASREVKALWDKYVVGEVA